MGRYFIETDINQYKLGKMVMSKETKKINEVAIGYFHKLSNAVEHLAELKIRSIDSDIPKQILKRIEQIKKEIIKAVEPYDIKVVEKE